MYDCMPPGEVLGLFTSMTSSGEPLVALICKFRDLQLEETSHGDSPATSFR